MTCKEMMSLGEYVKGARGSFSLHAMCTLCDFMKATNPRFDRDRWLAYVSGAAGPNGGKRQKAPDVSLDPKYKTGGDS